MTEAPSQLSTAGSILETAARLLADGDAGMSEIAAAAGVGRATLYRYYPTREALLEALAAQALDEVTGRIADASLDAAPVEEAIVRMTRALLTVADRYVVLMRERVKADPDEAERRVRAPLRTVFERGIDEGVLRDDVPAGVQLLLLNGLVTGAIRAELQRELGLEEAAAKVASLFLDGARVSVSVTAR